MNDEETRRAIIDPCLSDEEVYTILMTDYEPPPLSNPFTSEEIEIYCKENEETSLLMKEKRPQLMERIRQEAIEAHRNCCPPQPVK